MQPFSEACERNKKPILEVLRRAFADVSGVLEIGSGTGQHAVHFAANLPHLIWYPTERAAGVADLDAGLRAASSANIRPAALLDVAQRAWPVRRIDGIFSANTLHIMSWEEVTAMFSGIDAVLLPRGVVCLYGPFLYRGRHTAASNERFDAELRQRNPRSGIRDIEDVAALAAAHGLQLAVDHDMPANNRLLQLSRGDPLSRSG